MRRSRRRRTWLSTRVSSEWLRTTKRTRPNPRRRLLASPTQGPQRLPRRASELATMRRAGDRRPQPAAAPGTAAGFRDVLCVFGGREEARDRALDRGRTLRA
jgi:hypothetical protein